MRSVATFGEGQLSKRKNCVPFFGEGASRRGGSRETMSTIFAF